MAFFDFFKRQKAPSFDQLLIKEKAKWEEEQRNKYLNNGRNVGGYVIGGKAHQLIEILPD